MTSSELRQGPRRPDGHPCVAIVTGASGWLGRAMTTTLAADGWQVHAVSRTRRTLEAAFAAVAGVRVHPCDVTSDAFGELVDVIGREAGGLDALVNNAHVGRGGSLRTSTPENFEEAFGLAVTAAWRGIRAAHPHLAAVAGPSHSPGVINVASMYGLVAPDPRIYETEEGRNPPYYGAAKAALLQLTRYAAAELGPEGIRVNALVPGPFPGPDAQADRAFVDRLAARTMLRRYGEPDDLAPAIRFLTDPTNRFLTGQDIVVDGGWTSW